MNITSLKDVIKDLAQALQASTVFPAAIFVILNVYFILPHFLPKFASTAPNTSLMVTVLTIIVSYTLYALNIPLIRIAEGYIGENDLLLQQFQRYQKRTFQRLCRWRDDYRTMINNFEDDIQVLCCRTGEDETTLYALGNPEYLQLRQQREICLVEFLKVHQRLESRFPSQEQQVLATSIGNTIAAFEDYSYTHYCIDSVVLWPRLVPILKDEEYLGFVSREKSVFDFLLNLIVISLLIGSELFYFSLRAHEIIDALCSIVLMSLFLYFLYQGCRFGAELWGSTVRVAFDLYRHKLHKGLRLKACQSLEEECAQWKRVSQFIHYGNRKFEDFLYRPESEQSK